MNLEFRTLRADEIDVRIAQVGSGFVSLLLYKDARVDQNILDETVGAMNWQRAHCRDNANCIVSIWDDDKKMWISKEDTGTESYTEKEKGLASDSFKRACFNWGIGRELYSAPQIKIWENGGAVSIKDKKCYDRFEVTKIEYDSKKNITSLEIVNEKSGKVAFSYNAGKVPTKAPTDAPTKTPTEAPTKKVETITSNQIKRINDALEEYADLVGMNTKDIVNELCARFKVKRITDLDENSGERAAEIAESWLYKKKAQNGN